MRKAILFTLLILIVCAGNAQVVDRALMFKKGDQYEKQISTRSNAVLYHGAQILNISNTSIISDLYAVNDTMGSVYSFKITIQKITDTLNTTGHQMNYSSEKQVDTSSIIEEALNSVIGKSTNVLINKTGIITSVLNDYVLSKKDSLLTLSSLLPDKLIEGNTFEMIARLPSGSLLKKGSKWIDSVFTPNGKDVIHYTIESVNDSTTIVSFKGTGLKSSYNKPNIPVKYYFFTNVTGKMKVDNNSFIITERLTKTATTGYESINGIIFSMAKRSAIKEVIKKQ